MSEFGALTSHRPGDRTGKSSALAAELRTVSEQTAPVPPGFVERVERRMRQRRRRRNGLAVGIAAAGLLIGSLPFFPPKEPVGDTAASVPGPVTGPMPRPADLTEALPSGDAEVPALAPAWVLLEAADVARLARGQSVEQLRRLAGQPYVIVPVLRNVEGRLTTSWVAAATASRVLSPDSLTSLDRALIRRRTAAPADSTGTHSELTL